MKENEADLEWHVRQYCQQNRRNLTLSFDVPAGYEDACGIYDPQNATICINRAKLERAPAYERLFHLYHELLHAAQDLKPECFNPSITNRGIFHTAVFGSAP